MAASKSVADILSDYRKEGAAFAYDQRLRIREDPQASARRDKVQEAGFAFLRAAAEGRDEPPGLRDRLRLLESMDERTYLCPKCRDTGMVGTEYCSCLRRRIYIEHNLAHDPLAGPCSLRTLNLMAYDDEKKYPPLNATQRRVARLALKASEDMVRKLPGTRRGLLFQGVPGIGKTWFLRAIARQAAEGGIDVAFFSANAFFDLYHRRRLGENVDTSLLESSELLLLDDLGAEAVTRNVTIESLLQVLTFRSEHGLPTVIATNEMDLQLRYGERISSRLYAEEDYLTLHLVGDDLRQSPPPPAASAR